MRSKSNILVPRAFLRRGEDKVYTLLRIRALLVCIRYYMLIYCIQLFWVLENHVIGRCQGLFPPILSSAEKSPGNEVANRKPIARCTRDFSRAFNELQVIARNSDRFIAFFAPSVIGRSNYFGVGSSTVI